MCCRKVDELKGKNMVIGSGLFKSPKQAWKAKVGLGVENFIFSFLFKHADANTCFDGLKSCTDYFASHRRFLWAVLEIFLSSVSRVLF